MLSNANMIFYVLGKVSVKEQFIQEFKDVFEMFADFFMMLKGIIYDPLANMFGGGTVGIIFGMIIAISIMLILMKIINH